MSKSYINKNKFKSASKSANQDFYDDQFPNAANRIRKMSGHSNNHTRIILPFAIGEYEHFIEDLETLYDAQEGDTIEIIINCCGGNYYAVIPYVDAIRSSKAHVHGVITNICASGGTMIALACHSLEVRDHISFLVHQPSGGMSGTSQEIHVSVEHDREKDEMFYKDIYSGFMSESEIESVLHGRSVVFNADQVRERLEIREKEMSKASGVVTKVSNQDRGLIKKNQEVTLEITDEDSIVISGTCLTVQPLPDGTFKTDSGSVVELT